MINNERVLAALANIKDAESGSDIVSLGLIKSLEVSPPSVYVELELTTPNLEDKGRIEKEIRECLAGLDEEVKTTVHTTPMSRRRTNRDKPTGLEAVKYLVAVASGKGGVGKSTVAARIAWNLSQRGYKVGLLDVDLFGPSVPTLFDMHEEELRGGDNEMVVPATRGSLKLMSFGFWLGDSPAVMRGPMVSQYVEQFLHQIQWEDLDYLFLDLPPGTGDIQLTLTQSANVDGAVIVTTPQALAYADVGKAVLMFDKVSVPVLGVVDNMAYFDCPNCGTRHEIFGTGSAERLSDRFGVPILGQLPLKPNSYGGPIDSADDTTTDTVPDGVADLATATISSLGKATWTAMKPVVSFDESAITLRIPGRGVFRVDNRTLRGNCQCAVCVDEFTGERRIGYDDVPEDIHAKEVKPLGNYALYVQWSDGHATGFFPYESIIALGETVDEA